MTGAWLVLDTATPIAVVGVVRGSVVLGEHTLSENKKHAEGLVDAIDRALLASGVALDEIDGVGVGVGPGSFIGVRTGIATAKGLCLGRLGAARPLPLVGLGTLAALAHSAEKLPEGRGLAVVDAKRGEVYAQLIACERNVARVLERPQALAPADAAFRARGLAFIIGTALVDVDVGAAQRIDLAGPTVPGLARALTQRLAAEPLVDELASLVPDYCRAPDAKLPAVDPAASLK